MITIPFAIGFSIFAFVVIVALLVYGTANPNRVSRSEILAAQKLDGEPRNRYGETHEMFEMRVYRYREELEKIEKRRRHLERLIQISNWKPLR